MSGFDAESLLHKGLELVASGQEELGVRFFRRGLEKEPDHVELLRVLGETLVDLEQVEEAKESFLKCARLQPEEGGLWMYLGQLEEGKGALAYFEKGVKAFRTKLGMPGLGAEEKGSITRELSCALCTIAELYMSDLCFEPNAESKCLQYLEEADTANPGNPQALQGLANFRINQCKPELARPLIIKALVAMEQLLDKLENTAAHDGGGLSSGSGSQMDTDEGGSWSIEQLEESIPPFEFRSATCRILYELGELDHAIRFIVRLIQENDEIAEVWLLLAQCLIAKVEVDEVKENESERLTKQRRAELLQNADEASERAQHLCERLVAFDPQLGQDEQFMSMVEKIKQVVDRIKALKTPSRG